MNSLATDAKKATSMVNLGDAKVQKVYLIKLTQNLERIARLCGKKTQKMSIIQFFGKHIQNTNKKPIWLRDYSM